MHTQPSVYIVLLNWNGYLDTVDCVRSLQQISYKNYKIVIVDNGSTNKSVEILKKTFSSIPVLETKQNLGFSGGCNVGIKYALAKKADYVLLLNNDTVVDRNFLSEMITEGQKSKKIGILNPLIYYFDKKNVLFSAGGYISYKSPYPFNDPSFRLKGTGGLKDNTLIDCATGCAMLIKKEVFQKIGFYDEDYFLYAEDMDFSIRAKDNGFLLMTVIGAKVWHKVSGSSGGEAGNVRKEYYNTRNLILFSKKNLSLLKFITFNYYFLLGRIYEIRIFWLHKEYKKVKASILGLIHGYLGVKGYFNI